MKKDQKIPPEWIARGKSIEQLVQELQSFGNSSLEVRISIDGGKSHIPISLVGKKDGCCLLINCENN